MVGSYTQKRVSSVVLVLLSLSASFHSSQSKLGGSFLVDFAKIMASGDFNEFKGKEELESYVYK
jgi:hypothetical protein